ncbi:centromere protein M-like [Dendronephthya gigantea]|uniref:centromere protein M-like n=1 Tax=Dendronephthya gigantea TaxID=151771 RepID=UPI001069F539|nr:centromere protein M-like [Dendronephthya gigantea]
MSEKQSEILSRFKELPTNNHATILTVSIKGIGMENFVDEIMSQMNTRYSIQIRTTTSLPLPKLTNAEESRPRIDYIVFILDLTNQQSFEMIKEAVSLVDIDYFLGRCCFILSKAKQEHLHSVDLNEVTELVGAYNSTMLCGDLQNKKDRLDLAEKVLYHVEIACGFCNDVNPLLVATTQYSLAVGEIITT